MGWVKVVVVGRLVNAGRLVHCREALDRLEDDVKVVICKNCQQKNKSCHHIKKRTMAKLKEPPEHGEHTWYTS